MSQDQNSRDENRYPRFGNKPNGPGGGNDPNQTGKKSPKFNGYWIYFIILAVLIGFNFFGALSPNAKKITQNQFYDLLKKGEIKDYKIISNRAVVRVTLTDSAFNAAKSDLEKDVNGRISKDGPHMYFPVVSGDSFQDDMRKFRADNPSVQTPFTVSKDSDWFSGILQFILKVLFFIGRCILLMRKMTWG